MTLDAAASQIRIWRENPKKFVWDNFKTDPDPWQAPVLEAFVSNRPEDKRISLQACAGPGKSAIEAWCGWLFLSCYGEPGEHPKGIAVSITYDNLKANLWAEFNKWQQRSEFLKSAFTWGQERIFANDHPATWGIDARSFPKTASPEEQGKTLSGLHSRFVLVLIDESGSIPVTILRSGEQALSNCHFGKIVQAGNPMSIDGMLYAAATILRDQWRIFRVTGDPDDPDAWVHSPRVANVPEGVQTPADWARQQIRLYGRDNPWVMAYILGQFPSASLNTLLTTEEVEAAMKRFVPEDAYRFQQKRIGADLARFGDDRTVLFPRQGLVAFQPHVMRHARGEAVSVLVAQRIMEAKRNWGSQLEFLDATGGWAAGVHDVLVSNGHSPINVQFSAPAYDPRYFNRRAEIHFKLAEWVRGRGCLPPIPELIPELTTPTYIYKNGKFQIEEKDMVKKRLGRSPDLADGLATTFGLEEGMSSELGGPMDVGHATTEYDPYAEVSR